MIRYDKNQNEIYVSTVCSNFKNRALDRILEQYLQLGIKYVEISAPHPYLTVNQLVSLVREYQARGLEFIFHNYFPSPEKGFVHNMISRDPAVYQKAVELISNAKELAERTGVDLYCFHPGYLRDAEETKSGMFDFYGNGALQMQPAHDIFVKQFGNLYRSFALEGEKQSFFIGLENLFPAPNGSDQSIFCRSHEIEEVLDQPEFRNSNVGILIDLAHLKISSNLYSFNRDRFLDNIIDKYGDRIYEIHLSENDERHDLHDNITEKSWQTKVLKRFRGTGTRLKGKKTRICIESRRMTNEEILESIELVQKHL